MLLLAVDGSKSVDPDSYTVVQRGVADLYLQRGHTPTNTRYREYTHILQKMSFDETFDLRAGGVYFYFYMIYADAMDVALEDIINKIVQIDLFTAEYE